MSIEKEKGPPQSSFLSEVDPFDTSCSYEQIGDAVKFKGQSSLKQYIPKNPLSKAIKCGVDVTHTMSLHAASRFI